MNYNQPALYKQSQLSPLPQPRTPATRAKLRCACPGCEWHVARLEKLNEQLAAHADQLREDRDRLQRQLEAQSREATVMA